MRRAAGTVELVGHVGHRVPVVRILRTAHPPAHLWPMPHARVAAELSRTANASCASARETPMPMVRRSCVTKYDCASAAERSPMLR
eukprot:621397-Prymnesium_polylepis.1